MWLTEVSLPWVRMGPKPNDWYPDKEKFKDTKETREGHGEDGGRDWSDAATARGAEECGPHLEAGGSRKDSSPEP